MVISRKDGVDISHKMLNETNRKSNYSLCTRKKTEGEVSPISVEEIRKQLAIRWSWIRYVIRPASYWSMIKYKRTRDCMSREEMDAVLSSVIPYSWRLSELIPLFKGKCIILDWSNFWRMKLMSHTVILFERIINHMLRTIVQLGNIHFVLIFRRGRSTVDPVVDRPLLNTKWMLSNCTIYLSMWFIIR